ncbi:hypothetical protein SRB5_39230 [Streptomyces sp. RB5]|uniref:Uncharacterized protein n=1 Tax=Streptomyces smaragdinus TaxID=2585196 RepID=A0A7K0CJV1_9ACTN|nr:hypothetical protein [Streptomyces smaragdinus]MQY13770.1 hypothetical protein [Streptomyces smaragdinus]
MDKVTVELADEERAAGVFPAEWGVPAGSQFSQQRAAWVAERVQEHLALTRLRRTARERARAGVEHVNRRRQLLLRRRSPMGV